MSIICRLDMTKDKDAQPDYFLGFAATIADNGYSVVAVRPKSKKPYLRRWQTASFKPSEPTWIERHAKLHPDDSVGIGCGRNVIAIDIDERDAPRGRTASKKLLWRSYPAHADRLSEGR